MFLKDKTKKYKDDIFNTHNWQYDELNDEFTYPNNKQLSFKDMLVEMIDMDSKEISSYMSAMIVQIVH